MKATHKLMWIISIVFVLASCHNKPALVGNIGRWQRTTSNQNIGENAIHPTNEVAQNNLPTSTVTKVVPTGTPLSNISESNVYSSLSNSQSNSTATNTPGFVYTATATAINSSEVPTATTRPYQQYGCGNNASSDINGQGASGAIADGDGGIYSSHGHSVDTSGHYVVIIAESDFTATDADGNPLQGIWTCHYSGDSSGVEANHQELLDKQEQRGPVCDVHIDAQGNITANCDDLPTPTATDNASNITATPSPDNSNTATPTGITVLEETPVSYP